MKQPRTQLPWTCAFCTLDHEKHKAHFLQCESCGALRPDKFASPPPSSDEGGVAPRTRSKRSKSARPAAKPAFGAAASSTAPSALEAGVEADASASSAKSAAASLVTLSLGVCREACVAMNVGEDASGVVVHADVRVVANRSNAAVIGRRVYDEESRVAGGRAGPSAARGGPPKVNDMWTQEAVTYGPSLEQIFV